MNCFPNVVVAHQSVSYVRCPHIRHHVAASVARPNAYVRGLDIAFDDIRNEFAFLRYVSFIFKISHVRRSELWRNRL